MNAVEFIKQYGWEMSKAFLNNWSILSNDYGFEVEELKQLVDAWELVGSYGGLERAKTRCYPAKHLTMDSYHSLKQAIELVGSVNERV